MNPHFRLPFTHQWNVAVEQALGTHQTLSVTYAAALGRDLARRDVYPAVSGLVTGAWYAIGNESWSNYHSMQVQFNRSLSHGFSSLASYTWAHSLDTGSVMTTTAINAISHFLESPADYYGNSDWDFRHQFQAALMYTVPTPHTDGLAKAILGGWGVDTIFHARSSSPIDLTQSNVYLAQGQPFLPGTVTTNPGGAKFPIRPNLVEGQPIWLDDVT